MQSPNDACHTRTALEKRLPLNLNRRAGLIRVPPKAVARHSTSLPPLWLDNSTVTIVHTKADMFNKYYYSVSTHEDTSNLEALRNSVSFLSPIIQSVNFTPNSVYHELVHLDVSRAFGPDHVTPKLLKLCAELICEPLNQLFN